MVQMTTAGHSQSQYSRSWKIMVWLVAELLAANKWREMKTH